MWYDWVYYYLTQVNVGILIFIGIPFAIQMIYMLLFWLPKKTFKKTKKINRIALVIPAHNEEDVIYDTVKDLFDNQQYPKDMFDVYVIADNCTDRTEELAKKAGATVFVHTDPDPKHHMVGFALEYGFKELLKIDSEKGTPSKLVLKPWKRVKKGQEPESIPCNKYYDFLIRLDADNHINPEFFSLMNDAYNSGAKICRPYESALNMTQSAYTKACGLYYIFDSRCGSRVRERLHIDAHVNGPGSLIEMDIIRRIGGYDTVTMCEDTEFNFKRMFENIKPHFVEDAVVYEDLPSTLEDTLARNKRLGAGNTRMLIRYAPKMFFYAVKNHNPSYIEAFLNYLFIPICPILCLWLPGYYVYAYIYHFMGLVGPAEIVAGNLASGNGIEPIAGMFPVYTASEWCVTYAYVIIFCIGVLFAFCGILQGVLMVLSDYKKMGAKRRRDLISGVLLFPFFSIIYVITITIGVFSKPKWKKVKRNPIKKEQMNP